jgi:glucose/arabinose dehydrogenase
MARSRLAVVALEDRTTPVTLPTGFALADFIDNLTQPTALQEAPDGRFFITQQQGALRIASADGLTVTTALTLTVNSTGERGLLGVALDPNFTSNGFVYLYYTVPSPLHNRVSRFTVEGNTINPASEVVLVDLENLNAAASNHNGGALHFGTDGKLYVAVGDNATSSNAQSATSRFGKILRYNPDGSIPADNPTTIAGLSAAPAGVFRAIYAAGLRNPFTFDVDPSSSRIYVNDVGQNTFEEVNDLTAGRNFGWPATEGDFTQSSFPSFTRPLVAYGHGSGTDKGFAITGGAFYRPATTQFPAEYAGDYFFADFANDWIRVYDAATGTNKLFASELTDFGTVDLDAGSDGSLLVLSRGNGGTNQGSVFRVRFTGAPQIVTPPANVTRQPGQSATFTVTASGTGPLTYQWQRNNADIPGATQPSFTLDNVQLPDNNATFRVVVTNAGGTATSSAATLTVTTNQPPTPTILTPTVGTTFFAGQTVSFSGGATDAEDGTLPAAALSWRVDYFTGSAPPRPFFPETPGIASGSVTIPTRTPYTLPDVFYRFTLTARDSVGNVTTATRDIVPQTGSVTLQSSPGGAAITLDGAAVTSPFTFVGVVGVERDLVAPETVAVNGQIFPFVRWADGVTSRNRVVAVATSPTTFQANYSSTPIVPQKSQVLVGSAGRPPVVRAIDSATGVEISRFDLSAVPLPGGAKFGTETRVARGDVTGDGLTDYVVGAGPGAQSFVVIFDGASKAVLSTLMAFEPSFTGGVYVAAGDMDGDGKAEVVVSPDQGGGPRVDVYRGNGLTKAASFFGIDDPNFRGGARVALGDVSGDGKRDLVVSAGFRGGPRVAGYEAGSVMAGKPARMFGDFFAFEPTLRNGVFLAVGDIDGDGKADVIAGGGPGGGPRVQAFAGADLMGANKQSVLANFFAGDANTRNGVRLGVTDVDGDGRTDVVVGTAPGAKGQVLVYRGLDLVPGTPAAFKVYTAFEDTFTGGVFVG